MMDMDWAPPCGSTSITPGFGPGVMVETTEGPLPAEWLRAGDRVLTRDHGYRPLAWVGRTPVGPDDLPVCIPAGTLGKGLPEHDLILSPGHHLLLRSPLVELYFATPEALARVTDIASEAEHSAPTDPLPDGFAYTQLALSDHEVLLAEGVWLESYLPLDSALARLDSAQVAALGRALGPGLEQMQSARLCLRSEETPLLRPRSAVAARRMAA
ncbi:hypothetical protein AQS8620_02280 [Aquimixticola soesokkakensis]|uniref:Hedgehog/Intein (Hint) domain-containing protein n=1 Tax=Aquimixticola soesokkakensis TaxID=1519096 RepID=A0A1Y5SZK5_9RHOB|nr:Hint domain-containing protein [Aquimixticola soesokkakensis]SLN52260.1 hypothetical protein AQS8620_02280 [Aquimixticola soesokkakensis]